MPNNHMDPPKLGPEQIVSFVANDKLNRWFDYNYDSIIIVEKRIVAGLKDCYFIFYRVKEGCEIIDLDDLDEEEIPTPTRTPRRPRFL